VVTPTFGAVAAVLTVAVLLDALRGR